MRDLETSRQQTRATLTVLKMYMHRKDYESVQQQIASASSAEDLGTISFSLRFHHFRINAAIERGELVEVK